MKITDIIRTVIDLVDSAEAEQQEQNVTAIALELTPPEPEADPLSVIKQLSGIEEPGYANEPSELVSPVLAAIPSGTDMHHSKNPADIRTNAASLFPGFQARP
jgi:hypothetical protein